MNHTDINPVFPNNMTSPSFVVNSVFPNNMTSPSFVVNSVFPNNITSPNFVVNELSTKEQMRHRIHHYKVH
ncbi:hypothetical protein BLOT_008785 [Blomia tropicalis]|nr:hypothetical protein BLOT_008785 [Blomia tropicalis]